MMLLLLITFLFTYVNGYEVNPLRRRMPPFTGDGYDGSFGSPPTPPPPTPRPPTRRPTPRPYRDDPLNRLNVSFVGFVTMDPPGFGIVWSFGIDMKDNQKKYMFEIGDK